MQVQKVTHQPNFNGKVILEKGTAKNLNLYTNEPLRQKFIEVSDLIAEKKYDLFIYKNKQNPDFYNVAANKSLKDAKKIKEYTVKVKSDVFIDSIVNAANDAIDLYEKFLKG